VPEHRGRPPNHLLRQARLRMRSPSGSGRAMSRQERANAVNARLAGKGERARREATLDATTSANSNAASTAGPTICAAKRSGTRPTTTPNPRHLAARHDRTCAYRDERTLHQTRADIGR
jgi:hypothetical protein